MYVAASAPYPFIDIHCHLLPSLDDGAKSWKEALAMCRLAVSEGISTIIATPHQLGNFSHNHGDTIRTITKSLQQLLKQHGIPLRVLPGGDVRVEPDLIAHLMSGTVLTLADRRRHILLELPHELYFSLAPLLQKLSSVGVSGVLSHPERNQGILASPKLVCDLVDAGCLMQITAGSITGTFGPACQELSEWMLQRGLVHLVATDAHGSKSRRPLLGRAFERVLELTDQQTALDLFHFHPAAVCSGREVPGGRRPATKRRSRKWLGWLRAG